MQVSIQSHYAWRINPIVSTEETRYYLTGFAVFKHGPGVLIVATNGHVMGVFHDETGDIDPGAEGSIWALPKAVIAACKPARNNEDQRLVFQDGQAILTNDGETVLSVPCQPIDGTFPNWRLADRDWETPK